MNRAGASGALLEHPARAWPVEELAALSALSRSQFMLSFRRTLGMTPATFHTAWRLTLARRRLQQGERVKAVAAWSGRPARPHSAALTVAPSATHPQRQSPVRRVGWQAGIK